MSHEMSPFQACPLQVKRESRWSLVAADWQQTQLTPTGETQVYS